MSKAPWYPRDAGCSVVGGGEPTFNYIPISSNTSPQFSSIFLHFHRPCSIFLHFPCFGLLQEWLHWKAYLLGKWISRGQEESIWCEMDQERWCLYHMTTGWIWDYVCMEAKMVEPPPILSQWVTTRFAKSHPDCASQAATTQPWSTRRGKFLPSSVAMNRSPSPFQPIKVQHPAFSPKHIRLRLGMDCVGMGKLSQSCQMIHTRLAKGAQWVKEQDPIFRSKSRRRRRKISKTQVRPLSKQADLIGGKNKLGIGQVWW